MNGASEKANGGWESRCLWARRQRPEHQPATDPARYYEQTLLLRARHDLYLHVFDTLLSFTRYLLDTCFTPAVQHSNCGHA